MAKSGPNKGPGAGGHYRNEVNHLESGGYTCPTEARSATGEAIANSGAQDAPVRGAQRQANEKELRGGN